MLVPLPSPAYETDDEFIARHGGDPVRFAPNSAFLLPSGARLSYDRRTRHEPSNDPRILERQRQAYHTARLARTKADRKQLAAALRGVAEPFRWPEKWYGPPPANWEAALAELDRRILADEQTLRELGVG